MDQEGSIELRNWPAGQSMNEAQQRSRIVFRRNINTDSHFTDEDVEVILALRANNRTPHFHNNTNGNVHVPLYRKIYRLVFALILLTAGFPLMVLQTIWHRLRFLHAHLNFRDNVGPILLKILVHVITFTVLPIVMGRIVSFVIGQDFILYPDGMPIYENTTTIVANNSNLLQLNNSIPSNSSANFSTFSSMRRSGYHTNLFEKFTMVLVTELGWSADKLSTRLISSFIFIVYAMIAIIVILFSLLFHCLCIYFIIWKKWLGIKSIIRQVFLGSRRAASVF